MNAEQYQVAAEPQNKPNDSGHASACRLLSSQPNIGVLVLLSLKANAHFTIPKTAEV